MINRDLQERLFKFAKDIIILLRLLPKSPEYTVITFQLIKSTTSSGANYEESQAAVSTADFNNKIGIALKEMRETNYWIRLLMSIQESPEKWIYVEKVSEELKKILGSIYSKTSTHR
ncbi:MAG: four helix bundle protein [Bacteroidales bacterium]